MSNFHVREFFFSDYIYLLRRNVWAWKIMFKFWFYLHPCQTMFTLPGHLGLVRKVVKNQKTKYLYERLVYFMLYEPGLWNFLFYLNVSLFWHILFRDKDEPRSLFCFLTNRLCFIGFYCATGGITFTTMKICFV